MPLLPELLYEPLQVAVQTMPTDWKALNFSAWTNAVGAGVGALIGGLVSYCASVKAKLRVDTIKNAELTYRLARQSKSELHVIEQKRAMNNDLGYRYSNIRGMVEEYKDRVHELCVLIEIRFPKEVGLVKGLSEEVGVYFNERAVLSSISHPDARAELGINLFERIDSKESYVEELGRKLEDRFEKIIRRFKAIV